MISRLARPILDVRHGSGIADEIARRALDRHRGSERAAPTASRSVLGTMNGLAEATTRPLDDQPRHALPEDLSGMDRALNRVPHRSMGWAHATPCRIGICGRANGQEKQDAAMNDENRCTTGDPRPPAGDDRGFPQRVARFAPDAGAVGVSPARSIPAGPVAGPGGHAAGRDGTRAARRCANHPWAGLPWRRFGSAYRLFRKKHKPRPALKQRPD